MRILPLAVTPEERLAKRICKTANARDATDLAAVIAEFRRRFAGQVDPALAIAVEKEWVRRTGPAYSLTASGADLGRQSRRGPRTKRVMPF